MRNSKRAWTWLALIVGIAFIASLFIPTTNIVVDGRGYMKSRIPANMSAFIMGIKAYRTEYNRFPVEALTSIESKVPSVTRGKILTTLHPDQNAPPTESNPRKINFYDPTPARNKLNGLYVDEKEAPVLVDAWGTPYFFNLDQSGEGKVPNPDPRYAKKKPFIADTIIMYSAGPDRNPDTWEDDIMTWK